jgi:hypothetical protein
MEPNFIEKTIKVQAESCKETTYKSGAVWKASGIYKGVEELCGNDGRIEVSRVG